MLTHMRLAHRGHTLNTALGGDEKTVAVALRYLEQCREGWRRLERYRIEVLQIEEHAGFGPPPWR